MRQVEARHLLISLILNVLNVGKPERINLTSHRPESRITTGGTGPERARWLLDLDDNFKRLVKELGEAINESLSDSERIADAMGRIRAAGYDLFLVLEVTIGFNKRDEGNLVHRQKLTGSRRRPSQSQQFRLTTQDAQFLRALRITVDDEKT